MSNKRNEMITEAIRLLAAGTLPTALPNRLMERYSLTPERARDVAQAALKQRQKPAVK